MSGPYITILRVGILCTAVLSPPKMENGGHLVTKMLEEFLAFNQYHQLLKAPDNQF